jgi:endoglucanase
MWLGVIRGIGSRRSLRGRRRARGLLVVVMLAAASLAAAAVSIAAPAGGDHGRRAAGGRHGRPGARAQAAFAEQCPDRFPAARDPSNPLMLRAAPGSDPLHGANFFVDGPRHGAAAGAIATLLGRDPQRYPDDYSWARFRAGLARGKVARKLEHDHGLARQVALLSKIAGQPESQKISIYAEGGGPGAIFGQTQKIFCHNLTADPRSIPVFTTYFLHPAVGGCATPSQLTAAGPEFRRRVDEMAAATGNRPAVYLLEIDGIGSSICMQKTGALAIWEADLRYEALEIGSLPHTVVYLEGGYSDANSPRYTARVLNAAGVRQIRGFFTNDTHSNWTIDEIRWAGKVSRMTGGANYVVNTAQNGQGPLRPHNRVKNGNEVLCNPPGRGLGPAPTTTTGFAHADAFLWTGPPGNSSGHCNGGPDAGTFWAARAINLAAHAQDRLGPGYPSNPY